MEDKISIKQILSLIHYRQNNFEDAVELMSEVFEARKSSSIYGALAYYKILAEDEDAMEFCLEAYDYNSDDKIIVDNLIIMHLKNGDYEKAKELGCKNTHFVNANGLYDDNHYTTAYDLALIGCEFFNNEILCKMSSTPNYNIPPTSTQPDDIWVNSKNKLLKGRELSYPYLLGSKTGFVSQSRQTLVSGAEKDGMKLVCVVFKEETPYQFEDTVKLFQYGFENFKKLMVDDYETKYSIDNLDLFNTGSDLFGDSTSLMSMESDSYIIVPNMAEFEDTNSKVTYSEETDSNVIATIEYSFSDVPIGTCEILFSSSLPEQFQFSTQNEMSDKFLSDAAHPSVNRQEEQNVIFIISNTLLGTGETHP